MFYSKKGFTVAEILITIVLVTVVVGPILSSYMVGLKSTEISEKDFNMDSLAQELMSEIMEKNYEDVEYYGNIGREQDEMLRKDFDDVDDYNGYSEEYGEIKDISGTINDQYSEYRRQVDIFNESREPISSDDGLEFIYEAISQFGFETQDIKISRDGNRLFGINKTEQTLFCANPFSEEIEAQLSLDELPLNMALSPDSLKIYLNYGYKIEIYSYNPGEFNFSYELKGIDFNVINDIDIIEGNLVIATDKGIYSQGDLISNISPVDFVYSKFDKRVLVSNRTIYVYADSKIETPISSNNIAEGKKVTSCSYDEYQNKLYISTNGDYVWIYDFESDMWNQKISTFSKELEKLNYLYVDGEYYFGGVDGESEGFFKSNLGDLNRIMQLSSTVKVKDLKFDTGNGVIWILGKHLHKYDISTGNLIEKVWSNTDNRNNISFEFLNENMFILSDKGIIKFDKNSESVEYIYSFENLTDMVIDNQKIYFTDSMNIYSINTDFTELETMNLFGDITKLMVSKDGKTIYMPSENRKTIFYLDPFTNVISGVDVPCYDLIQSSSGNTLWSPDQSKLYRIQNSSVEEVSVDNNYTDLINIDKSDQFLAFDPGEATLNMYSYRDAFKDSFDFFSGYNFASYFTSGNKGFNVKNIDSKVIIDTKSAVDGDHNDNIGSIIFYRTFVFPIPKYLNTLQVISDHEFSGGKLEMFCYSGKINKESFDQKNGDISDADAVYEITDPLKFDKSFNIPPTNMITIGFKITDSSSASYAELIFKQLEVKYNQNNIFRRMASNSMPFSKIDCYAMSWDNKSLYIAQGNSVYTFDLEFGKIVNRKTVNISESDTITALAVSKDNNTVFAASDSGVFRIKEPMRKKIIKVTVENKNSSIPPYVVYSNISNWKTSHSTRVIPHIINREYVYTSMTYNNEITDNIIWYPDKQYIIDGNLTVKSSGSLIILTGCNVKFKNNSSLKVEDDGKLMVKGTVFTSINDNTSGAVMSESTGIADVSDYIGIIAEEGSNVEFDHCTFKYAQNSIDKAKGAIAGITNSVFTKNEFAVKASSESFYVAGHGYVYNITLDNNKFMNNKNDLYLRNFAGDINNNIFVNTEQRTIDFSASSILELNNNDFYRCGNNDYTIISNSGELNVQNNKFIKCNKILSTSNSQITMKRNVSVLSGHFLYVGDNTDNKKIRIFDNKIIGGKEHFIFSDQTGSNDFKAFMNYLLRTDDDIKNESALTFDFKDNYWGNNSSKNYINIISYPFLLYGSIKQDLKLDSSNFIIHHHIRVEPGITLSLKESQPFLFSEYIKPFIDVKKFFNSSIGNILFDKVKITQEITPEAQSLQDNGYVLNTEWMGFRNFGNISLKECTFDNAELLFRVYNSDEGITPGGAFDYFVYNEVKENNNNLFYFDKISELASSFNYGVFNVFYNRFKSMDSKIRLNPDLEVPDTSDKIDMKYNYWGNNNISEDFDNEFENSISIFPYAISENVYSSIYVSNYNNPLIAIGDLELNADIIFSVDSGEILFATDSGIKSTNGAIKNLAPDKYVKISDIEDLASPYNKPYFDIIENGSFENGTGVKYFDFWGDINGVLKYIGEDLSEPDYSDLKSFNIFDDENISGLSLTQVNGNIILERALFDTERLLSSTQNINFKILDSSIIVNKSINMNLIEAEDSDFLFLKQGSSYSQHDLQIKKTESMKRNFFNIYFKKFYSHRRDIAEITILTDPDTHFGLVDFMSDISNSNVSLHFANNSIFDIWCKISNPFLFLENDFYDGTSILIHNNGIFQKNNFGVFDSQNNKDYSLKENLNWSTFSIDSVNEKVIFDENKFNINSFNTILNVSSNDNVKVDFKGNIFNLSEIRSSIFDCRAKDVKFTLNNNVFLNNSPANIDLFAGQFKDLSLSFNHFENDFRIQYSNVFSGDSVISNNNFIGTFKVDSSILSNLDIQGNYYKSNPYFTTTALQYKVDISKSPDFDFDIKTEELYGLKINNESYLTTKKEVPITLWHRATAKYYDFGQLNNLFYDENTPNSLFVKVDRKLNPTIGKYYVNYTPVYISTNTDPAYLFFNDSVEKTKYRNSLFINHNGLDEHDNTIIGDWNDNMRVIIPVGGTLGGNPNFDIPLPSDPNTIPSEPLPPSDFKIVSQITPVDNGYSESYDFDGNIKLKWENNDSPTRRVFFYKLFKYSGPFSVITPPGYTMESCVVPDDDKPYIDYEINGLQPGYHGYLIKAYNSNTNPTSNSNVINIYGDGGEYERKIIVHEPPKMTGPFNLDISGGAVNIRTYCEEKAGANAYIFRLSKDPFFKSSSEVLEIKKNNNYLNLSDILNLGGGVYYVQAKAGVEEKDGIVYNDYTDWGPRDILFLKSNKMLGILISLEDLSGIDHISRFKKMSMPAKICKDEIDSDVTPVFIIDREKNILFDKESFNTTIQLYQRFLQMLSIEDLDDISHVPADMIRLYMGDNIDGFVCQSNYTMTSLFINKVRSLNYSGGLMGVDYPGRDIRSVSDDILNRMGFVSASSRSISGKNSLIYPDNRFGLTSAGISLGTIWDSQFESGKIINLAESPNASWSVHLLSSSRTPIMLERNTERRSFLFNRPVIDRNYPYYVDSLGNYTITDGDIIARGIRFILNIAPPPPQPLNVTYYDFAAKDTAVEYSNLEYYVNSPEDETTFYVFDIDGNIPRAENGKIYPFLNWIPDKNVSHYELERVGVEPPANLGFTTESVFEGILSPEFTSSGTIQYILRAFNPWGASVEKRIVVNFDIPEITIPNIEWGDPLLIDCKLKGARQRAGKVHIYITKDGESDSTKQSFLDPYDTFTMSTNAYSDDSKDIGNYSYSYYYTEAKGDNDLKKVFEKTDTRTSSFKVKPPSLLFDTPDYNVDIDNNGSFDHYEDWDGDYNITWRKKNPALNFAPPGQFKIYLEDKIPSGVVFGILGGAPHDTFSYDMGMFSIGKTPGYHELRLWLEAFSVKSDMSFYKADILPSPILTEQRNKSGVFYINEYDKLFFKVNSFAPRTANSGNTKFILKYKKSGAHHYNDIVYNYTPTGVYFLDIDDIPGFSKTRYEFMCEFIKYNNGVEVDKAKRSSKVEITFKEYIKGDFSENMKYHKFLGKKYEGKVRPEVRIYEAGTSRIYKVFIKSEDGFYSERSLQRTGEELRNYNVMDFPDSDYDNSYHDCFIKYEVYDTIGNMLHNSGYMQLNNGEDWNNKYYYMEF